MANTLTAPAPTDANPLWVWTFDTDGDGAAAQHGGGPVTFGTDKAATMGGGTITWEWSPDGGSTWVNLGVAVTAATTSAQHLRLAPGLFRPSLSGSTAASIKVFLR